MRVVLSPFLLIMLNNSEALKADTKYSNSVVTKYGDSDISSPWVLDKTQTALFSISGFLVKSLINKSCHISRTISDKTLKEKCHGIK